VTANRPLTDAQERNLIVLGERSGLWVSSGQYGTRTNTLESLGRLDLAEVRHEYRYSGGSVRARITPAGLEMLASMGD
jgi:hypothetical protein